MGIFFASAKVVEKASARNGNPQNPVARVEMRAYAERLLCVIPVPRLAGSRRGCARGVRRDSPLIVSRPCKRTESRSFPTSKILGKRRSEHACFPHPARKFHENPFQLFFHF